MRRVTTLIAAALVPALAAAAWSRSPVILPGGQLLAPPGQVTATGTMPQGIALSPDGRSLAVVESGVGPPALRLLDAQTLSVRRLVQLPGAFGKPVWFDDTHVLVAGANADALLTVDVTSGDVSRRALGTGTWPAAVALSRDRSMVAIANDGNGTLSVGSGERFTQVAVGAHPADAAFSPDGRRMYVALRSSRDVAVIDPAAARVVQTIHVGLHPCALAPAQDPALIYVAECDDDAVGLIDTRRNAVVQHIAVGLGSPRIGSSPNALAVSGDDLFVSLGAQNAIAVVRNGRVTRRIAAGWYPTGVAAGSNGTLYVLNGKGEGAPANPLYDPRVHDSPWYVGLITVGSVRSVAHAAAGAAAVAWHSAARTPNIIRRNGPIAHVIYVIKENRTYDQVLGDIPGANGDPQLAWFGLRVTPNQHAIARRFGVFDNAYTDAQVSAGGHNWTDAAFSNDYVERFWPPNYGDRRDLYDFQDGTGADVPHNGYLWDAAVRQGISFRDYGEDTETGHGFVSITDHPNLQGRFDPLYVGWNLRYSDLQRIAEWKREFNAFVAHRNLPQLEIVYLPNDHTAGSAKGMPTPQAFVATNDAAVGQLVETVSHSPYWRSTAIFILEDDAQNGPDHVSDQRSTFYIASAYAKGGVHHEHYSTVSFVRTIELLLGMRPLSIYDATVAPLDAAFENTPRNAAPYTALAPRIDTNARNAATAYGSALSARMDFSRPDAADSSALNRILAHLAHSSHP